MRPHVVLHIRKFVELLQAHLALHLLVLAAGGLVDDSHRAPELLLLFDPL